MTDDISTKARQIAARLRPKAEKALEVAPGPWHHMVNRHNTGGGLYGQRQGAMELKKHPAMGAGKALYSWQGEDGYAISDFIAATDPATTLHLLDLLDQLTDRLETEVQGYENILRSVRQRAEKAEAQLAQVTQERDEWKIELGHRYEEKLKAEAEAASLREALQKVREAYEASKTGNPHDEREQFNNLLTLAERVVAALTPTQQEEGD